MAALVKVVVGPYAMPNGKTYVTGDVVSMSDAQRATMTAGDFPAKVLDITVAGSGGSSAVTSVDGASGAVSLTSTYAKRGAQPWARGQVVLVLDDVRISHKTIALPYVEAAGGRVTLACNWNAVGNTVSNMTQGDVLAASQAGHEIASHSMTHPDMTSLTAAQRTSEWDTSKSSIEAVIGAGLVKTWIYPVSAANATTDIEAYLRYDRVLTGASPGYIRRVADRDSFLSGRFAWTEASHNAALSLVRIAAQRDVVVTLYVHDVDGSNTSTGVTQAHFQALVDLAVSLGVPLVTASHGIPAHAPIPNAGFETSDLSDWALVTAGTGTIATVADTPDTGLTGANSLQITGDGTGQQNATTTFRLPLDKPNESYTASVRAKHNRTSGVGGTSLFVKEYDSYGTQLAQTQSGTISAAGSQPWQQLTAVFTPNVLTRTVAVLLNQATGFVGTSNFDHAHIGPTRLGVLA